MTFGTAITHNFRNMFRWSGRDPRSSFWWFVLFAFLVSIAANLIDTFIAMARAPAFLESVAGLDDAAAASAIFEHIFSPLGLVSLFPATMLWSLVAGIVLLSCGVRRRHDCDRSGWVFVALVAVLIGSALWGLSLTTAGMIGMVGAMSEANPGANGLQPGFTEEVLRLGAMIGALALVQTVAAIVIIILMVAKGTDGPNRFGEDPLR